MEQEDDLIIPEAILEEADAVAFNLLPAKSKEGYTNVLRKFRDWMKTKNVSVVMEEMMVVYFNELIGKLAPPSLWSRVVNIVKTKNYKRCSFVVTGTEGKGFNVLEIYRKYAALRPKSLGQERFVLVLSFEKINSSTRDCYRRTSATLLANASADILKMEVGVHRLLLSYAEGSVTNKIKIETKFCGEENTYSTSGVKKMRGRKIFTPLLSLTLPFASSASETSSNTSVNGESFYLHNPQEVIYNRVKDLFESSTVQRQPLSALTVKVEVHSSSSGAGSDENLSSSDLSERSGDHDNDYEDIYLVREESNKKSEKTSSNTRSRSRDSGSHSRSGSASSSNSGCNVVIKVTPNNKKDTYKSNEFLPNPENYEKIENKSSSSNASSPTPSSNEEEIEKVKLEARHSMPLPKKTNNIPNSKVLKRVTSVPAEILPPPPPPPPPTSKNIVNMEDEPRGAEVVEIVEEPTLKPSEIAKGACKTMSALTNKRLNSSCSDLTIVSLGTDTEDNDNKHGPNLVNKQRVLPFIPPSFPGSADSNNLIKPSEYLRSIISEKRSSTSSIRSNSECEEIVMTVEERNETSNKVQGPPPPPLPELNPIDSKENNNKQSESAADRKQQQPLSTISIQDLNSVQLRRTDKMIASKTFSAPTRSMSLQCLQSEPYLAQKTDLIAELKLSKDITGIKKLKIERAKVEETKEKELYTEISKQFTTTKFVEKIPDKDNTGNIIPVWKRQMLAKKAAERARKELEEQMLREAEEKRLQSIPQWKRQLLQKKEEAENRMRSTLYTPKVIDDSKSAKIQEAYDYLKQSYHQEEKKVEDINNNESVKETISISAEEEDPEEETNIIPWRAQLRKTNSKLNLLD